MSCRDFPLGISILFPSSQYLISSPLVDNHLHIVHYKVYIFFILSFPFVNIILFAVYIFCHLARNIKESIYIRVNNPTLNNNIGKFNLSHIWDRVLLNTKGLTLNKQGNNNTN